MDTAQWPQEIVVKPIEEIVTNSTPKPGNIERNKLARPQKDQQALNCPRCNSTNTKFCYYNNYSLTQPRYFCKTCRRYWTEGGSLRNIPVGGGSRKNKRSSSSSSPSVPSSKITRLPDLVHPHHHNPPKIFINNNNLINQGQDLNLGYSDNGTDNMSHDLVHLPNMNNISPNNNSSTSSCTTSTSTPTTTTTTTTKPTTTNSHFSALELLTGLTNSRGFNSFMPMPIPDPNITSNGNSTSGLFSLPEFKPSLGFSLDGLGTSTYAGLHNVQESSTGRLLFPFEDLKQVSTTTSTTTSTGIGINIEQNNIISKDHQQAHHDSAGYWTGMLGGGSW